MKLTNKRIFSLIMTTLLIISIVFSFPDVINAEEKPYVNYDFLSDKMGYADGTVSIYGEKGTYWLYWADELKALDDYREIVKIDITDTSATYKMPSYTAIPVDADKLIVFNSQKEPTDKSVSNAYAVFDIPENKLWNVKSYNMKYSFMSLSDIHIDSQQNSYKYSHTNWANALDFADEKSVDFIITSGDNIHNDSSKEGMYVSDWRNYLKILSQSNYSGPVYESLGNHEIFQDLKNCKREFINSTGLEGDNNDSEKPYYEKEIMGDHFIFMALENNFNPYISDEFTDEQLNWLEGLLKKYRGDGKNIYIIEHSPFYKYGAGDRVDGEPYYDIPLNVDYLSNKRLQNIFETYKDIIFISGHTHISFENQFNYSDNNGSSCQMIHNSSVGGSREIINNVLDYNYTSDETEGYIVDVYKDGIIFKGANLKSKKYDPNACYLVNTSSQRYEEVDETSSPTTQTIADTQITGKSDIYLKGTFNSWGTSNPFNSTSAENVYTVTLTLEKGGYEFKINTSTAWYGNTGTVEDTTFTTSRGGWVMDSSAGNCKLNASGGVYQFDFDTSTNKLKIYHYPQTTEDNTENTEPSIEIPKVIIGDADENGKISIKDATDIGMYLCKKINFSEKQLEASDVNFDGTTDINDVTLIQMHLAELIGNFENNALNVVDKNLDDVILSVKNNLDLYYRYSSYDCYRKLKKEYLRAENLLEKDVVFNEENTIKNLVGYENKLLSVVDVKNVDATVNEYTLYFENSDNWSDVYAYCWGNDTSKTSWPGEKCTYSFTNESGNKVYEYKVNRDNYDCIIFSNGSSMQTKDIYITDNNACYSIASSSSPYEVDYTIIE